MANFYVANLDRLNRTVTVSKAGQNRAFIERRLHETMESMGKAEEALRDFQSKNKTVAVDPARTNYGAGSSASGHGKLSFV
ncbi:MAG: putative Lipopolysaccharide biosynthesis protein [Nitrospira sp.]|nr:putative Lipopolysaccharide biosynthesis protein [Nitrospira sp.]